MKTNTIVLFAIMLVCLGLGGCALLPGRNARIAVNRTPEQLAQKLLDSLRNHNKDQYVNETLFTKQQARQFAKQLQNVSSVATEVEAFPWLGEWEQYRQNNVTSWERMLSQGIELGIT